MKLFLFCSILLHNKVFGFWDEGSSTPEIFRTDIRPRQSFFRWQMIVKESFYFSDTPDTNDLAYRRSLHATCGISIDFLPLGTGTILNKRTIITSANFLEPYMNRQEDLRVWALGGTGKLFSTPWRYRVWRVTRIFPKSNNPEHWHGPTGTHVPRHDVAIIHTTDMMYIYTQNWNQDVSYDHYASLTRICNKDTALTERMLFHGSGFEYLEHIMQNYKIFYGRAYLSMVVNCETYLPKWWGKFICIRNYHLVTGVPNGGGLHTRHTSSRDTKLIGIGCFEIRYNEDRIMVFTDLRYYVDWVYIIGNYTAGDYYEYAFPEWTYPKNFPKDNAYLNNPVYNWQIPFGKK